MSSYLHILSFNDDRVTYRAISENKQVIFFFFSFSELMEAMWKPQRYKWAYAAAVLYTYLLTIPDSVAVYWAYGDILLHRSNAFGVLPQSTFKNVCVISMILHQVRLCYTFDCFDNFLGSYDFTSRKEDEISKSCFVTICMCMRARLLVCVRVCVCACACVCACVCILNL